jgi:hypothetical protein
VLWCPRFGFCVLWKQYMYDWLTKNRSQFATQYPDFRLTCNTKVLQWTKQGASSILSVTRTYLPNIRVLVFSTINSTNSFLRNLIVFSFVPSYFCLYTFSRDVSAELYFVVVVVVGGHVYVSTYSCRYLIIDQIFWWPVREFAHYILCYSLFVYSSSTVISITSSWLGDSCEVIIFWMFPDYNSTTAEFLLEYTLLWTIVNYSSYIGLMMTQ